MESLDATDPRTVGGYPLFARLGAGGMGQVYLARTPAGRALALKTVRSEFGLDPGFGERFAREIRHADRVRSPWTVAVVDYSPPGTRPPWLATEYVAAPSLAEWVSAHGPLPEPALASLAAELCEALRSVHAVGLAHRDVKPSNVLLGPDRPLLIDFGIARAAEDSRHTRTGGVIGSPGYMAPEQATAGASAEPGDLFALAAVLVYAGTGHGPFNRPGEEPSTPALMYRIVHEDGDLTGLPDAVAPLVHACLAKEPADRPTAEEALALLREAGHRTGVWHEVPPPGLTDELRGREARVRTLLADPTAAVGPSPYSPTAPLTAPGRGPGSGGQTPAPPHAAYAPPRTPSRVSGPVRPTGPYSGPQPAPWGAARRAPGMGRGARVGLVVAGVLALCVVVGVILDQQRGSGDDNNGNPGPSTSTHTSAPADALPASWVGTWVGTGPGNPSGSGGQPRSDRFTVTLTLHAGARGEAVGQDVSNIPEAGTGAERGCTEALSLAQVRGNTMTLRVTAAEPTDPDSSLTCLTGHEYSVSMTDARTLRIEAGPQAEGAPSTLTKRS
ncbi:serine/threonine-protein kinase [Streptomyces sp. NPDC088197]|uniref:serine/threonine-protein kinase n=1 Tax=Streptomyces sp. NPDC088197 TaxID=3365840 RepID=UPI0038269A2B